MGVSVKCQYALRALFELALRKDEGLVRLQDVAEAQGIPQRFLENILNQLRQGGFVESRRGKDGGFVISKQPSSITIGDIIKFIDGPIYPVDCLSSANIHKCEAAQKYGCIFINLWEDAREALETVYNSKTLQDFLDATKSAHALDYCI